MKINKLSFAIFFSTISIISTTNAQEKDNKWEYKQYSGKINDKYKINMTIIFNQDPTLINGYYSYNGSRNTLKLSGYREENNSIIIDEYDNNKLTGSFKGDFVGDSFKGIWHNSNLTKEYPFYVTRNYNNKTLIKDTQTKNSLIGLNNCSLQWVSWDKDKLGTLKVQEKDKKLIVIGSQKFNGETLDIDGYFTSVDKNRLDFNGKISTRVSHINSGKPCYREGDMTFLKYDGRNFWRLQEMQSPCDVVTDYVDISIKK
ncbi:MAG: hypothetical protein U0354_12680 [Candidatus Sericytochromatia bacterium]